GYRHLRLRSMTNQPLELPTLFICTRIEYEIGGSSSGGNNSGLAGSHQLADDATTAALAASGSSALDLSGSLSADRAGELGISAGSAGSSFGAGAGAGPGVTGGSGTGNSGVGGSSASGTLADAPKKRPGFLGRDNTSRAKSRQLLVPVYGVCDQEECTLLKLSAESVVADLIGVALSKCGKPTHTDDYLLLEESDTGDSESNIPVATRVPRLCSADESVAQLQERGSRLVLRRRADNDPSYRAWMTTLIKTEEKRQERLRNLAMNSSTTGAASASAGATAAACSDPSAGIIDTESDDSMPFLVCVYNVTQDQPYTVLKAFVTSTAADIVKLAVLKSRNTTISPEDFSLVEEVTGSAYVESPGGTSKRRIAGKGHRRVLAPDDQPYRLQKEWKRVGRFILERKENLALQQQQQQQSTQEKTLGSTASSSGGSGNSGGRIMQRTLTMGRSRHKTGMFRRTFKFNDCVSNHKC
ncbi:hypothetical protein BOX15_Mlig030242g1, partial [Macrostomum lignano]